MENFVKSPFLQSALRELHVFLRSARFWATFVAVVLIFWVTGPYGTAERLAAVPRLGFWFVQHAVAWSLAVVNVLGTLTFSTLAYQASRQATLENIDDILCAAAEGVRNVVPALLIDEAEADARTEPAYTDTYRVTHRALERYFGATRLNFLYAIALRPDGSAFELVSNLSPEQKKANIDPLKDLLRKPYKPSPGMVQAARKHNRREAKSRTA